MPVVVTTNPKKRTNNDINSSINHNNDNNNNINFRLFGVACANNTKVTGTDSAGDEDSNSSSGVTTELEAYPQLNLDLSLGPPSHLSSIDTEKLKRQRQEQQQLQQQVFNPWHGNQGVVCLCQSLGFQCNQGGCHCKAKGAAAAATSVVTTPATDINNVYRFCKSMNMDI